MAPMQNSIPEDDWVTTEAEALLDTVPGLRADLDRMSAEHAAGTLQTVDTATVRAAIEASSERSQRGE